VDAEIVRKKFVSPISDVTLHNDKAREATALRDCIDKSVLC
jgi:hypothetical protein